MGIRLPSEPMPSLQTDTINIDINNAGFMPKPRPYLHFGSAA